MGNLFSNLYYLASFPASLIVYSRRMKDDGEHGEPGLQTQSHERRGNENNGDVSEEKEKENEAETNGEKQEEKSKHHSSSGKHKRKKHKSRKRSLNKSKERAAGRRAEQTGSRSDKPSQERAGRRSRPPLQERPGQSDAEPNKRPTKSLSKEALSGKENRTHSPSKTRSPARRPCCSSPDPSRRRDVDRQESPQRNEDTDTNDQLETVRSSPMPDDEVKVGDLTFNRGNILKIGTCGAIVFRGEFNRRLVAVKRIPLDESICTDQEVDLMREADDHPNIVRFIVSTKDRLFRYRAFSSFEATLIECVFSPTFDRHELQPVMVLQQIIEGVAHLHSLKIVNRAIDPQNILVSTPDPNGQRKFMISEFKWADKVPVGSERKFRSATDIMGAVRVMSFVIQHASNWETVKTHEFIAVLDIMSKTMQAPKDFLKHPFFWKPKELLDFFQEVSDRLEHEPLDGPILRRLERWKQEVFKGDWLQRIDETLRKHLTESRFRRYDGRQVRDLLRAIRNLKHHYWDKELPDAVRETLGFPPDDFVSYFTSRFPFLLMHTYEAMSTSSHERPFQPYYPREYSTENVFFQFSKKLLLEIVLERKRWWCSR